MLLAVSSSSLTIHSTLLAQGITTSTIRGTVRTPDSTLDEGARVRVVNLATGFAVETHVRRGRFLAQGLLVGGPYVVLVRQLGFEPQRRDALFLTLGQPLDLTFILEPVAARLEAVHVDAQATRARSLTGIGTTISDSLLHRLPTLNRDLYDFVRLAPQITTRVGLPGGLSGGGVSLRFNNYLIDGTSERYLTGNSSVSRGGKSLSIEAVKEYQVLLTPFDVRYGDFAGALINAVTRTGTNEREGTAFVYARNDRLSRLGVFSPNATYERAQYGFALSGPIIRDRLHFLVAPELQRLTAPARGPYLGQPATATPGVPVRAADVSRFAELLQGYGLTAGSGGAVSTDNSLANLFARVDLAIPSWNSRAVLFHNYASNANVSFSRARTDSFPLSSYRAVMGAASRLSSAQLHTSLSGGGYNELILARRDGWTNGIPDATEPIVLVAVPNRGNATAILKAGSQEQAQGVFDRQWTVELTDNLTLPIGEAHEMTFGAHAELFQISRGGVNGSFGTWTFSSLDSLANGVPERFETKRDLGGADLPLGGSQIAIYVGDRWRATNALSLVFGLRGDALLIRDRAPYNPTVDMIFTRRTDDMPAPRIALSPRLGFDWDVHGAGRDHLRGGVGIFTGRFPLAWAHSAIYSYGNGIGTLRCGNRPGDAGAPPHFEPDYRAQPRNCANGLGLTAAPRGDVDLIDRHLRMAQTSKASLSYDRQLPWHVEASVEALLTRTISDFAFVNLNLAGPQSVDAHGRVMYGRVGGDGVATPTPSSDFSEVIDLRNNSSNHSSQLSGSLVKRFSHQLEASASYTFSRTRDAGMPLRAGVPGIVNWASARALSGRHDDMTTDISLYDLPHRLIVAGTYTAPWRRWTTDLSFYYVGESGSPFTYVAWGIGRRGDLNADGAVGNDPVYIPKSAFDPAEIAFSGKADSVGADLSPLALTQRVARQQSAFEALIDGTACLRRQRGRIMERNSCREPWAHTSIASLRQSFPVSGTHRLAAQLDVFNVLNLLRSNWGRYRTADNALLEQVSQTIGPPESTQPVFRFDPAKPLWLTLPTESAYQIQFAVRYSF